MKVCGCLSGISFTDEWAVPECAKRTKDFEDIREYALMKGNILAGYIHDSAYHLEIDRILYFAAAVNQVLDYSAEGVYSVKRRLWELERAYQDRGLSAASNRYS